MGDFADAVGLIEPEAGAEEALKEEDIAVLEDNPTEAELESAVVITGEGESLTPDTPVYRLRLLYSHETFFATYRDEPLGPGRMVVVPTRYGRDLAQVISPVQWRQSFSETARIERPASKEDISRGEANRVLERDAFDTCKKQIEKRGLGMKLVLAHYLLDEPKVLFFYTSDGRVDFRELLKDLVGLFKCRVELRQIGPRDEPRVMGGLGICGRCYCCHSNSAKLKPVSIKMIKEQNVSLNPMKISGPCGRLLCCFCYESLFYTEQRKFVPDEGTRIVYDGVTWKVREVNVITGKIRLDAGDGREIQFPPSAFEKSGSRWTIKSGAAAL